MMEPWFTPDSARRVLPQVRPAAERMCRLLQLLEACKPRGVGADQPVSAPYFTLLEAFHRALAELRALGVRVQDPRQGLLDFPARRAGRDVLLCWRVGEPTLAYWRDALGAVRRPLDEDGPWDAPVG
ncbi:MAG TPA: DUF2203 family protein [Candidatus Polarisedimenticolaceae bacterium]|nr:DUF2203 family protein [Candidatus Polarisedimenticolaceae bacterium]